MFHSATIKLTTWYLAILMSISLLFSVVIYQVALSEINARLENLQLGILSESDITLLPQQYNFRDLRQLQEHEASTSLLTGLVYANIIILVSGGACCYLLARRTLDPIKKALDAQSRFTSDASHELRTPLAAMKTELEVLLRSPKASKDEMREVLESNLEEVNKLTKMSHTLLQLSKAEYKGLPTERVQLEQVAHDAIARFKKRRRNIKITLGRTQPSITANYDSIVELLSILLDNAIKYSPSKSSVVVYVGSSHHNRKAVISVSNKGEGIADEHLPHIFDRFYRADSSRTGGKQSGYGLGLSLAKKIADIHNAAISVSSKPGEQTTFKVTFSTASSK